MPRRIPHGVYERGLAWGLDLLTWAAVALLVLATVLALALLQAGQAAGVHRFTSVTDGLVVAPMGIGLGLWWSLFAGPEALRLRRDSGVPVHPGWRGYVFPLAALAVAIAGVGAAMDSTGILVASALATVIVLVVWLTVAVRTVRLLRVSAGR